LCRHIFELLTCSSARMAPPVSKVPRCQYSRQLSKIEIEVSGAPLLSPAASPRPPPPAPLSNPRLTAQEDISRIMGQTKRTRRPSPAQLNASRVDSEQGSEQGSE
jgi:hypothetical protein